jgi:hypothetical protein
MGGSFVASPQGMSSRNCMEASETGGGSETIWHLQALFGKGEGSGGALGVGSVVGAE